jgi:hypothetical protein
MKPEANAEVDIRTAICTRYEQLLQDCQVACDTWTARRNEIREAGLSGKQIDDELRKLQAKYARAYAMVRNHVHECETCQWVSRLESSAHHLRHDGYSHVA